MKKESFIFFGDLIEINEKKEIELVKNYILKKANKEQVKTIKNFISDYTKILHHNINRYEFYAVPKDNGFSYLPLDKKNWNYWVIEFPEVNMSECLSLALGLAKIDLTILFLGTYNGLKTILGKEVPGIVSNQLKTLTFFYNTQFDKIETKIISKCDVNEIKELFHTLNKFKENKDEFDFIEKALEDFSNLQVVPKNSPFRILGYFSILELLLTNYKPNESSINTQLQTKINLVNNQAKDFINFREYFGGADTNTLEIIIAKLYQYRNDIAHGNKSDFEKQLKIFKNSRSFIQEFLRDLTKNTIIFAIQEPKLILDLKKC